MGCFTPFKTSTCRPFEDSSEEAWCSPNFFYVMKEVLEVITIAALHILKIYVTVVLSIRCFLSSHTGFSNFEGTRTTVCTFAMQGVYSNSNIISFHAFKVHKHHD